MNRILQRVWNNRETLGLDLAMITLCAVALVQGVRTTADLEWPYDVDQEREIGLAQAILDHRYGADHLYQGETIWYNPLVSIIIANLSRVTGMPPPIVTARAGPYLNLFAPIAFYFLVAYLFNRWIALAAATAFLFAIIPPDVPSGAVASYSPWVFGENFVQALFYLTLAAYCKAFDSKKQRWYVAVGVLLGITFLGQTAPAVILGAIMIVACVKSSIQQIRSRSVSVIDTPETRGLGLIVSIAFVVSLPFTFSILGRYHLRILNSAPSNWMYEPLAAHNFLALIRSNLSWFSAIAGVGLFVLLTKRLNRHGKPLLLAWIVICCVELGLNFLQQVTSPPFHLMFVPAYHFLFYSKAIENILFGLGLVFICRSLSRRLISKLFGMGSVRPESNCLGHKIEVALTATGIVSFFALVFPAYGSRFDFTEARTVALNLQQQRDGIDAYHWILLNTQPDDIFLAMGEALDLRIVAPAGRKLVTTSIPEFSNPYVPWGPRLDAAKLMSNQLESGSPDALATLVKYQVKYIITSPAIASQLEHHSLSLFLFREFAEDTVIIYRVPHG